MGPSGRLDEPRTKERTVFKSKLVIGLAALALVVGSGITYRLVTGQCPVGAFCHFIHGDTQAHVTNTSN
jgi:hypothetical protein